MQKLIRLLPIMLLCVGSLAAQEPTVVSLIPNVHVKEPMVRLADVATIRGGEQASLIRLGELEVAELPRIGAVEQVSRSRVEYLLLLAGFEGANIHVEGEPTSVTLRGRRSTDATVVLAVKSALAAKLGVPETDVDIQLTRPLSDLGRVMQLRRVKVQAFPLLSARLGSQSIQLGVYADGNLIKTITASVDAKLVRTLPIVKRTLPSNKVLEAGDFEWKQSATPTLDTIPDSTDLVGKRITRRLQPGDVIRPAYLSRRAAAREDYVVNARDNVKVIARKGQLRVTLGGAVALQRGRIGDTIRLRNPTSRKTLTARLVSSDTAELRL